MITGIHFLLTYACNFECDHCFLYCGPNAKGTFSMQQIRSVLRELGIVGSIEQVCIEGGEPFLFYPLMVESVRRASDMGFKTAIETNCYWATTSKDAELWLEPLRGAGLSMLEVSDDAYHHEEEDNPAKRALVAARRLDMEVSAISIEEPAVGNDRDKDRGTPIYVGGPKFRGRAVEKLIEGLPPRSWEEFTECPLEDLADPGRVHVDPYGNVHLCQGLSMGNMWQTPLSELIRDYDAEAHPICGPLVEGGPVLLARKYNVPHEDQYVDACHLCTMLCIALIDRFPQYLAPRQVYGLE
jgi:MoaA/NifB/PqqE/SkfB family radical SAM enzyme